MSAKHEHPRGTHRSTAAVAPMQITKVTYDGETVTVAWAPFEEDNLSGFIVTINQVDTRLDNYPVNDPTATSRAVGYSLQAGATYQCWVTPTTTPLRIPDSQNASDPVPIPYNA
jgi:hypothetical protein